MTDLPIPRKHASTTNYASGPAVGTPSCVDPGAALAAAGIIPGAAYAAQNINFTLNALTRAARRDLAVKMLRLRSLDVNGSTPSDTTAALGAVATTSLGVLVAKGDTNGIFRYEDTDLASQSGVTISAITTLLRKLVDNGSRVLGVGAGGVFNAFSTNSGNTWSAGGSTGLIGPLTECVWDGTDFIVSSDAGGSVHSTNAVAWTAATGGSDISDTLTGGHGNGMAVLAGGTVVAAGKITNPAFAKTTNHGLTWANTGGTIPSAATYVAGRGYLAGNGGTEIYWLGNSGSGLDLFVSTNGVTWALRSTLTSFTLSGATTPKLLMCQTTGVLVGAVALAPGGVGIVASYDRGFSWTDPLQVNLSSSDALALAGGRLFATIGAKLYASDGVGTLL